MFKQCIFFSVSAASNISLDTGWTLIRFFFIVVENVACIFQFNSKLIAHLNLLEFEVIGRRSQQLLTSCWIQVGIQSLLCLFCALTPLSISEYRIPSLQVPISIFLAVVFLFCVNGAYFITLQRLKFHLMQVSLD